jgi:hypothetical protein
MYNRILKRPMFKRGGPSYQSQGTGITSPYDVPRGGYYGGGTIGGGMIHGNPMGNRTGFEEPELRPKKEVRAEMETVFETPKGTWLDDVIGSFGAYSTPYKDDGSAKTIGEMGAEQAASITEIRKARKDKQDLAKLSSLEGELEDITAAETQANKVSLAKLEGMIGKENALAVQELQNSGAIDIAKIQFDPARTATGLKIKELRDMFPVLPPPQKGRGETYDRRLLDIIAGTSSEKDISKIAAALIAQGHNPADAGRAAIRVWMTIQAGLGLKRGGRVGYQMGTPNTGAMPVQQASLTETIDTPTEDITATETVTEGQQGSVQMPYQEFRAAIPAEVSDDIVQLIYYNQDAFADFAQISTQADVYAFNNKYGVSLVLPMDTETT